MSCLGNKHNEDVKKQKAEQQSLTRRRIQNKQDYLHQVVTATCAVFPPFSGRRKLIRADADAFLKMYLVMNGVSFLHLSSSPPKFKTNQRVKDTNTLWWFTFRNIHVE